MKLKDETYIDALTLKLLKGILFLLMELICIPNLPDCHKTIFY